MLTALPNDASAPIEARQATTARTYSCVTCGKPVLLKAGRVRIPHFAHLARSECPGSSPESQEHLEAKLAIYDALRADPRATGVEIEKYLGISRPDIYFEVPGARVAVEVQRSDTDVAAVMERTERYAKMNMAVLWVLVSVPEKLKAWQKWLHVAGRGRVYVWEQGQFLRPVHYSNATTYTKAALASPLIGGFYPLAQREMRTFRLMGSQALAIIRPCVVMRDRQPRWWLTLKEKYEAAGVKPPAYL